MFVLIWTTDVGQAIWNFEAKGQVPKHPKPSSTVPIPTNSKRKINKEDLSITETERSLWTLRKTSCHSQLEV